MKRMMFMQGKSAYLILYLQLVRLVIPRWNSGILKHRLFAYWKYMVWLREAGPSVLTGPKEGLVAAIT